jgi:MFS family permease
MAANPKVAPMSAKAFSASTIGLFLICLMYGITSIDRNNVSTVASIFERDLHLTNRQIGLVYSAFAYPYLFFQITGGWVSDRFGARIGLTVCGVIWASVTLLTGTVSSLAAVLFFSCHALLESEEGATFPMSTGAMSDWTPKEKRAFAQRITHFSARLGNALTPPLVG